MSQLRAPAARADRREGGRHGRPGTRPPAASAPEAQLRPQLLRAAVLPAVVVALSGAGAVLHTVRTAGIRPTQSLWIGLAAAAVLAAVAVLVAVVAALRAARSVTLRCTELRRTSVRRQDELRAVVDGLRRGEDPDIRRTVPPGAPRGGDEFDQLSQEMGRAHDVAVTAVVQASQFSSSAGTDQKVEVFVNLARRLQSLVHREIQLLDELENEVEDPDLLKGLFHVDHLATRIRRHAENLAVLGGAISRRQWSNPVSMSEVMRSSIAEVEQYSRVKLVPPIDGTLRGHAVADIIHLLAELVENATVFSAPHTTVLLRAQFVTAGLAIEVEDRGLGMPVTEQNKMNALLADPDQVNVQHLLQDGRIGLFVVSALARRHGIAVRLQNNIYGGVQAVLVLPEGLLGEEHDASGAGASRRPAGAHTAAVPAQGDPPPISGAPLAQMPAGRQGAPPLPSRVRAPDPGHVPQQETAVPQPAPPARLSETADNTPLPVRGERGERPNPAAAVPGVTHGLTAPPEFVVPAEPVHSTARTAPDGAVRGRVSRPRLPRRRSQENLVPQLKDGPAPRKDDEQPVLHDPGLMAAFQRGIDLAEAADPRTEEQPSGTGRSGSVQPDDTHFPTPKE
ncbi:ATP-binding protein [Streptomyces sp. NBC_00237]|uniref:sensor histidine kinase n=1 Tax=Streptomyces sp. NBC_00237 TaxID=2975687 RepID=UPI0022579FC9|nr:ATP-binding protein [Streptomyces sp. NBC_00237]MCX5202852.1 ATP-binding protein [Streptomyces sp. NBC_00237]